MVSGRVQRERRSGEREGGRRRRHRAPTLLPTTPTPLLSPSPASPWLTRCANGTADGERRGRGALDRRGGAAAAARRVGWGAGAPRARAGACAVVRPRARARRLARAAAGRCARARGVSPPAPRAPRGCARPRPPRRPVGGLARDRGPGGGRDWRPVGLRAARRAGRRPRARGFGPPVAGGRRQPSGCSLDAAQCAHTPLPRSLYLQAPAEPRKRTFRKFSYRGVDLEQLLELPTEELVKLFGARQRRR